MEAHRFPLSETVRNPEFRLVNEAKTTLGLCRSVLGDFEVAEQLLLESANALKEQLGPTHARTRQAFAALVSCYEEWDETEKADAFRGSAAQAGEIGRR